MHMYLNTYQWFSGFGNGGENVTSHRSSDVHWEEAESSSFADVEHKTGDSAAKKGHNQSAL